MLRYRLGRNHYSRWLAVRRRRTAASFSTLSAGRSSATACRCLIPPGMAAGSGCLESGTASCKPWTRSRANGAWSPNRSASRARTGVCRPVCVRGLRIRESVARETCLSPRRGIELKCGIWVVDVLGGGRPSSCAISGGRRGDFRHRGAGGVPLLRDPGFQQDTLHGAFVIPPRDSWQCPTCLAAARRTVLRTAAKHRNHLRLSGNGRGTTARLYSPAIASEAHSRSNT